MSERATRPLCAESQSLRNYLKTLPAEDVIRISDPIDIDYRPTALVLELENRRQTPIVRSDRRIGFGVPVVTNLFASGDRIGRMVGTEPGGFNEAWMKALANLLPAKIVDTGAVHEVVRIGSEIDAATLPISRHFEKDAGRYIGSGILVCKDPDTGTRNLSYQRLQLKGPAKFGASLHSRGHIWEHLQRCEARGRNLEVAIVIGVHPAVNVAAAAKVAMEIDEFEIAGALLGQPIELVKCKTIDVEVPAQAEIVIEGEILADQHEEEGPFGEYTGYSTFRSTKNVFVVKAITHRTAPILHDIIPGYSMEHLLLGRAAKEAHTFMRLKEMVPGLKALNFPKSGTHFHAYMSFKKTPHAQAPQTPMLPLLLASYLKLVIAVDEAVNVFNEEELLLPLATRFHPDTSIFTLPDVFCNPLDPSSREGMWAKLALAARAPLTSAVDRAIVPPEGAGWAASLRKKK